MKFFAMILEGRVLAVHPQIEDIDGVDFDISDRFHPDYVAALVPYDPSNPPSEPPDSDPVPPGEVTMRQAQLALHRAGLLTAVTDAIDALPEDERIEATIEWEKAGIVRRDSDLVAMLAGALDLSEGDLNDLFAAAAAIL